MQSFNTGEVVGAVRNIDETGRISLPKEHREKLGINQKEKVEIFNLKDGFYIRKLEK